MKDLSFLWRQSVSADLSVDVDAQVLVLLDHINIHAAVLLLRKLIANFPVLFVFRSR